MLWWVVGVCAIPLRAYLALFVLPGVSLTLVRSFAEHKAAHTPLERTAIVEAAPPLALLFLNNNLHYAHHERPDLPWHALPAYYRAHRVGCSRRTAACATAAIAKSCAASCSGRSTPRSIRTTDSTCPNSRGPASLPGRVAQP